MKYQKALGDPATKSGNILDRFTYGAVVDYFAWHYMFEFAIFNFADVMIDLAVVIIIYMQIVESRREKKLKEKA